MAKEVSSNRRLGGEKRLSPLVSAGRIRSLQSSLIRDPDRHDVPDRWQRQQTERRLARFANSILASIAKTNTGPLAKLLS
ncbi:hypothetical protein SV7mr_25750 [Stieleria bergensis]|uniref:Uncharacterized protein n=1 Tax=Stieleria bergensis TaxID=2528025 RepID=A0A517SVB5_9BACT|nr:hypothetical protein SV7mr_25750 [Planctomycetes bacterium SV_7m_r]